MTEISNMQYFSAGSYKLSFNLLPAGTFHQLAGECCHCGQLAKCTSWQGNFKTTVGS